MLGRSTPTVPRLAWLLLVPAAGFASALAFWLLWEMHPALAFLFNVVALYLCIGFRHDTRFFSAIHMALRLGEPEGARSLLEDWRGTRHEGASASEIARSTHTGPPNVPSAFPKKTAT